MGPVGAGKTTAIRSLSDTPPVDTDVPISVGTAEHGDGDKSTTTVGLDYGTWRPTPDVTVALVGTPGQDRFAAAGRRTWAPTTRILLWLRADRGSLLADAAWWLPRFTGHEHLLVIVISHCTDGEFAVARRTLAPLLHAHGLPASRVQQADARDRESVLRVACAVLDLSEDES